MSFDLRTHIRGPKGNIISEQPYRCVIDNGEVRYERPIDSGTWYDASGNLIKEAKKDESKAPSKAEFKDK